ncbi:conserved oligomeric Golgi complex subunit 5 isoform X1 [Musca domestica]|uniref:Conserved oligomeric Golgi complex subunit 5 n=2 Tax=Musca domestica TaxID=7370 RepID=A0ABM3V294_MUSDO|nr:conserved oligomeric Golgi complex subunit 5 isoform X1 [Musca domestica]
MKLYLPVEEIYMFSPQIPRWKRVQQTTTSLQKQQNECIDDDEDITASLAAMNLTIGDQIQELSKRLNNINEELQQQVRDKHGALLQQATHAGRFDTALNSLADDVQQIRSSGYRLRQQVDSQFQLIENRTKVLARLHELSHLLRSSKTLLTLTNKLKGTKDVLKQAELHYELNELIEDPDMKKIEFVQAARNYVINSKQKIRNLTQMQLVTGLQERNEQQVCNALKIFMNFNTLEKSMDNLITTFISDLEQALKECFAGNDISVMGKNDPSTKPLSSSPKSSAAMRGPGKTPQLTTTQNFRAKFWKSLHWLIYDELYEYCTQVLLLNKALEQVQLGGMVISPNGEYLVQSKFWQATQELMRKYFTDCPAHITQTLQEGLSKLLSSVRGFEERVNREFLFDEQLFIPLEVGYVSKCGANMKACLAGVDLPNNETVDNFIRVAATELSNALVDTRLSNSVSAVFISCSKDFCTKLESQIKLGPDSVQVVDMPNTQQIQNTLLANILYYFKDSVRRMLRDLGQQLDKTQSSAKNDITKSLEHADLLITTILQQIMNSIISTINIIILSIHREPGLNTEKISTSGPSMYMKELQEFIQRVWTNHISAYEDNDIVTKCAHEVAKRCIDFFIHNLSIMRPISHAGRQRLKNDCAHMENALKPLCSNISELGNSARMLRAMSFLIIQNPTELVKQNIGTDSLVPSYIILLLLFGHGSAELQSPHTTVNWSNERLIEWLEGHSEREKLELISGALQRYRDSVRRKKSEQYDEVYPLMVEFFEKASKNDN